MAWNTIAAGLIADANKLNDNFNLVAGGSRQPRTSAGASFVTTDGAYDIGSENARWDELYVNTIDFDGSVTSTDRSIFVNQSSVLLSATASSIEVTGLDGDSLETLIITGYFACDTTCSIYLVINGDSASNYGWQMLGGTSTTIYASRNTGTAIIVGEVQNNTTGIAEVSYSNMKLYTKTGNERTGINHFLGTGVGALALQTEMHSFMWNDTSNTITSLKFYTSDGNFETGTSLNIWGRS